VTSFGIEVNEPKAVTEVPSPNWYAVYTRSRHEKQVERVLRLQSLETYLPLRRTWSRRQDCRTTVELPALPGYLFVRCALYGVVRARLKKTPGVIRLVENAGQPCVIPEVQIASLQRVLTQSFESSLHPYLNIGDRVQVLRGPFAGTEGYLVRVSSRHHRLVITVDWVSCAVAVDIDAADVARCDS
jgi:transcription termination/antitermination protein NusG